MAGETVWFQKEFAISAKKRGCHLITDDLLSHMPEIQQIRIGVVNVHSEFIKQQKTKPKQMKSIMIFTQSEHRLSKDKEKIIEIWWLYIKKVHDS